MGSDIDGAKQQNNGAQKKRERRNGDLIKKERSYKPVSNNSGKINPYVERKRSANTTQTGKFAYRA